MKIPERPEYTESFCMRNHPEEATASLWEARQYLRFYIMLLLSLTTRGRQRLSEIASRQRPTADETRPQGKMSETSAEQVHY